jgi:hypothetical protein
MREINEDQFEHIRKKILEEKAEIEEKFIEIRAKLQKYAKNPEAKEIIEKIDELFKKKHEEN